MFSPKISTMLVFIPIALSSTATMNPSLPTCEKIITKWTLWASPGHGLAATLKVPVTEQIQSWKINFALNKNFTKLNFFRALTEDKEGSIFSVSNQSWSGKKEPGDLISFSMLGDYEQEKGKKGKKCQV